MSYTSDVKKELTTIDVDKKCCQLAEIAGFMRFAGSMTITGGGLGVKVSTENPAVARLYLRLIKQYFGEKTALSIGDSEAPTPGSRKYELLLTPEMNAEAILLETGMLGIKEGGSYLTDGISPEVIRKRCCKKSALRGIFLAAGSISDPLKGYHLEITCLRQVTANEVKKLLGSFGLQAKISERRKKFVVYIKDGEQIADFLKVIGATKELYRFEDARTVKALRNRSNRESNFVDANIQKAVNSAQKQISDINFIVSRKGLDWFPPKLRDTAVKRIENPELSLSELSELFTPQVKKSGLAHRFEKISRMADQLRSEDRDC